MSLPRCPRLSLTTARILAEQYVLRLSSGQRLSNAEDAAPVSRKLRGFEERTNERHGIDSAGCTHATDPFNYVFDRKAEIIGKQSIACIIPCT